MTEKLCTYCEFEKNYGENPSLYEMLFHMTEQHGDRVNEFFQEVTTPHPCKGCLQKFDAGLAYLSDADQFAIDAYCGDCIDEEPYRKLVKDVVSRSAVLHMRDELKLGET